MRLIALVLAGLTLAACSSHSGPVLTEVRSPAMQSTMQTTPMENAEGMDTSVQ